MSEPFSIFVRGTPTPKGSKRVVPAGGRTGGRPILIDNDPKGLRAWEYAIRHMLQQEWKGPPLTGAVSISLQFTFLLPASISAKSRPYPTVSPDGDKLERACWDALTGICFRDDAQVVRWNGSKDYGEESGVRITIAEAPGGTLPAKPWDEPELDRTEPMPAVGDAVAALMALGYTRQDAQRVRAEDREALIEALRKAGSA